MRRGPVAAPLTAGVMVLLAGCTGGERADAGPARLEMEWSGQNKGRLAAPATAEWCDSLKVLEIRALSGDSGIAIALYPTDTIRSDSYAVMPPAKADSVPPAAAVALRYFGETSVKGYQGDSGRVLVRATTGGRVSGRFSASLKSAPDGSRLRAGGGTRALGPIPYFPQSRLGYLPEGGAPGSSRSRVRPRPRKRAARARLSPRARRRSAAGRAARGEPGTRSLPSPAWLSNP